MREFLGEAGAGDGVGGFVGMKFKVQNLKIDPAVETAATQAKPTSVGLKKSAKESSLL